MKFISKLFKPRQTDVPDRLATLHALRETYAKGHPEAAHDAAPIFAVSQRVPDNSHPRLDAFTFIKNYSDKQLTEEQTAEIDATSSDVERHPRWV